MKKSLLKIIILSIMALPSVYAESWDDFADLDRAWDGQKSVTNKEFEQVMDALQARQKKREAKQQKKKAKKISGGGTSLHTELNPDTEIKEVDTIAKPENDGVLLNVPVNLVLNGKPLDKGYYKVIGERDKDSNKVYIKFYQSDSFMGETELIETEDDFDEDSLDFAKIIPYNDSFVKIIFGSIKFNGYSYLPFTTDYQE